MATAAWRSASGKMMLADLPPSSKVSGVRFRAAISINVRAVAVPPVKLTLLIPGCPTSAAPASGPPVTTLSTPGGSPAKSASSANRNMPKGAISGGLATTAFPAARAGPHFWPMPIMEPFQGGMAAMTP